MDVLTVDEHGRAVLPQSEGLSRRSKEDAMGSYLMMFASVFIAPIPLINILGGLLCNFSHKRSLCRISCLSIIKS